MTSINGTITTFLSALRHDEATAEVQSIITHLGGAFDSEIYNDTGVEEKYLSMPASGAELLFIDRLLDTVFLYPIRSTTENDEHNSYSGWPALISELNVKEGEDGDVEISREAVHDALAQPAKTATRYDLYEVGDTFVHFEFNEENRLVKLTLMARDPRANVLAGPAQASIPTEVTGNLPVLTAAIGHTENDTEAQAAFALFESEYTKGNPSGGPDVITQYLQFSSGHVQLKNDVIASIFFSTGLSFNDPVPAGLRFPALVDGLSEKPSREAIRTALGAPYLEASNFELYNISDASVHVEYINTIADSISVSALPTNQ